MASDVRVSTPEGAADALATPPTEAHELTGSEAPTQVQDVAGPQVQDEAPTQVEGEAPTQVDGEAPTQIHEVGGGEGAPARDAPVLHLADGLELVGEFAGSGFKKPPFIARRADGQVVQMHQMLFRLAEQIDGRSDLATIAERFSHAIQRQVQPTDIEGLIDQQLRPLGIVAPPAGAEATKLEKVDPLLALKFRAALIPDGAVRALTTIFRPLFLTPVVVAVVLAMIGLDVWLFFVHGISQSVRSTLYAPALMLMLIGAVILATAFHEIGHATATRYGGAKPGVMGAGIYLVWPAFYTDITDAYRLGKAGRLRADLGGVYFNAVFSLVVAAIYFVTSFQPLLLLIVLQNFTILEQAMPLLRLDGYYILSDLTGVPDIYLRIRAVLSSLIPGRTPDQRVTELKRWVRATVTVYVLFMVLFMLLTVLALVINLPRILATGYDSAALRFDAIGPAFHHGHVVSGVLDVIQMLFLILPTLGLGYTAVRLARRLLTGALRWSSGHRDRQGALVFAGTVAILLAFASWWPNGQYRPVQPGERGTIPGLFQQIAALPSGRASLTAHRERQLHGAPTEVQLASDRVSAGGGPGGESGSGGGGSTAGGGSESGSSGSGSGGSGSGGSGSAAGSSGSPAGSASGSSGAGSGGSGSGSGSGQSSNGTTGGGATSLTTPSATTPGSASAGAGASASATATTPAGSASGSAGASANASAGTSTSSSP